MTLLAAFQTLLYRYCGQDDIVVGSPIANRRKSELEGLIGLFTNLLPLRTNLSGNPSFRELLERVRQIALDAYAHQDIPFGKLLEELKPNQDPSRPPLFQVVLVLQNTPTGALVLPGLTLTPLENETATAKFELLLSLTETEAGLQGSFEYNTDLFDAATIERMVGHFQTLLEGIVANPDEAIATLPLLTEPERHQLLVEWNDTRTDYPQDKCVHQLFEEQVERTPEAIAVVFEDQQLTYRELNQRANQLAHYLQTLGVGPEVLVGICVERSLEMVVGLPGILKASGAYVPLDPTYPSERLAFMLEDAQVPVLLTSRELAKQLPECSDHLLCLDGVWESIAHESDQNPVSDIRPDHLAYVIYTSGSTGKPKGVMNTQRGVVNRLLWMQDEYQLTSVDRVLQKTPFSFDVSVWEFFWPLLTGARLVVARPEGHKDRDYLVRLINQAQITTVHFVPSMLHAFLEAEALETCYSLKRVICSGEALPLDLQEGFFQRLHCELYNLYGPTETAIDVTHWQCQPGSQLQKVPIGRPVANTQLYILDSALKPVPIGVAGELHIGGVQLARGYHNRSELTAERFIHHEELGTRLYKTGDLCRYLADGNIEYLGRIDHQVKIRGFRIELGEIEAILSQYPSVQQGVVLAREDQPGDKRLVAYVVVADEAPSPHELRNFLKQTLPEYMIPSVFVTLESLPLTPSGKLDRKALPKPEGSDMSSSTPYVAPRTPLEQELAEIWAQVLNLEQVGIHDNFFGLGGHSLLATQVVSRVQQALSIDLPLRFLFEFPTIAELSQRLEAEDSDFNVPPIEPIDQSQPLPLSFAQQRLWFLDQLEGPSATYNMPAAFRIQGHLQVEVLEQVVSEMMCRHETLRTVFVMVDGAPVQVIKPPTPQTVAVIDLQDLPAAVQETEVKRLATEEAQRPFDLAQGPLLRVKLLQLSPDEHMLLTTMHHIISDGWSIGVFIRESIALYMAFVEERPSPLAALPTQYADYAHWQQQSWKEGRFEQQLTYWQQQLQEPLPISQLPIDGSLSFGDRSQGEMHQLAVPADLTAELRRLGQRTGATLFMILMAALQLLLFRLSGQTDVIVGTPVAGRQRIETEGLIGLFLNLLSIRTDLSDNPTFHQLLNQVRTVTLDAYSHQDIPFEKLVEALQPRRELNRHPVFDVVLNFINVPQSTLELPGLTIRQEHGGEPEAKFLLNIYAREEGDQLMLQWVYPQEVFSVERILSLAEQFHYLLSQIVADPAQPINTYSLVTPDSCKLLPDPSWLLPEPDYPPVTSLFLDWAERTPDQAAVCQDEQHWTYRALRDQAQAIAQGLMAQGLQPGDVVAVSGSRSFGLIASILGVLLSGGILLTLDPHLPDHRRQLLLQESRTARLILVGKPVADGLSSSVACLEVDPDSGAPLGIAGVAGIAHPLPQLTPDSPAYIFFTSGTTGVPKAVLGWHKGLAHFLHWQRQTFAIDPSHRVAQLINLSFDAVLRDIFLPLTSGATLCLPADDDISAPSRLWPWLDHQRISLLHSVPSVAQFWLSQVPSGVLLRTLKWAFFSGEVLSETLVRRWRQTFPEAGEIINLYGPTETTLVKCCYRVPQTPLPGNQPIGWALPEAQALILNSAARLCGVGEPGEIVLRSHFRTLGYLNAPAENQRRFRPNPFRNDSNDLIYYTGDRGRYRPDGSLEILGRLDQQIKIRGVRIEPAEIEALLTEHAAVRQAVVIGVSTEGETKKHQK
jgi:amino acid adenylation domain-containing protein